jgi:hypothetical protein
VNAAGVQLKNKETRGDGAGASASIVFLTASDIWHLYGDLTRNWSALDRDCAASTCQDIEWDDHRWNGCATSSLSQDGGFPASAFLREAKRG